MTSRMLTAVPDPPAQPGVVVEPQEDGEGWRVLKDGRLIGHNLSETGARCLAVGYEGLAGLSR